MITFKVWLVEALHIQNDIHHNISVQTLKRIAKNSPYHRARFVISKDDKLHGANSENFMHNDIRSAREHKITGEVGYNHKSKQYSHVIYDTYPYQKKPKHKHLDDMEAAGVPKKGQLDLAADHKQPW